MTKTKLVAISGIASAVALACLLVASFLRWFAVVAGVMAAVAVSVPILADGKNWLYSVLAWLASSVLGGVLGVGNIGYVVIIATFAMPFAIFKCLAESKKADGGNRVGSTWKWIVYFVLCEVALALTAGAMYLFTPAVLQTLVDNKLIFVFVLIGNIAVPLLNFLLNGAFEFVKSAMKKSGIF